MPEIIMKKQEVTFVKTIKRKSGKFEFKRTTERLLWKPKELHEFLKEVLDVRTSVDSDRNDDGDNFHDG